MVEKGVKRFSIRGKSGFLGTYSGSTPKDAFMALLATFGDEKHYGQWPVQDERHYDVDMVRDYEVVDERGALLAIVEARTEDEACGFDGGESVRTARPYQGDLVWDGAVRLRMAKAGCSPEDAHKFIRDGIDDMERAIRAGRATHDVMAKSVDALGVGTRAAGAMLAVAADRARGVRIIDEREARRLLEDETAQQRPFRILTQQGRLRLASWVRATSRWVRDDSLDGWVYDVEHNAANQRPGEAVSVRMRPWHTHSGVAESYFVEDTDFDWAVTHKSAVQKDLTGVNPGAGDSEAHKPRALHNLGRKEVRMTLHDPLILFAYPMLSDKGEAAIRQWVNSVAAQPESHDIDAWFADAEMRAGQVENGDDMAAIVMRGDLTASGQSESFCLDESHFESYEPRRLYAIRGWHGHLVAVLSAVSHAQAVGLAALTHGKHVSAEPFTGDLVRDAAAEIVGSQDAVQWTIMAMARALRDRERTERATETFMGGYSLSVPIQDALLAAAQAVPALSFEEIVSLTNEQGAVPENVIFDADSALRVDDRGTGEHYDCEAVEGHEDQLFDLIAREHASRQQAEVQVAQTQPAAIDLDALTR